jgi:hypothetical protein
MAKRLQVVAAMLLVTLAAAPATQAQDIDPGLRADVEKLLEVTGALSMGQKLASLMSKQTIDMMQAQQQRVPDSVAGIIKDVLDKEFTGAFEGPNGLRDEIVRIYASHFTRPEIAELLKFYDTDIGKKTITVMPQLAEKGAMAGQKWAIANMPHVMDVLQQRLRAEGFVR